MCFSRIPTAMQPGDRENGSSTQAKGGHGPRLGTHLATRSRYVRSVTSVPRSAADRRGWGTNYRTEYAA
jgi:hypothetical protein